MFWILFAIATLLLLFRYYKWVTSEYDWFEKLEIKYMKTLPFLGSTGKYLFFKKLPFIDFLNLVYYQFPEEDVTGFLDFGQPVYVLRNPELVKQLTVKEFDNFPDHKMIINTETDDLLGNSLVALLGQKWKDMRGTLSPVFTGSKMRQMFQLINESVKDNLEQLVAESKAGTRHKLDVKDLYAKVTSDIIASCAFGIKVNTFKDPDNEFYKNGTLFRTFNRPMIIIKFFTIRFWPWLAKVLQLKLIDNRIRKFFWKTILENMDEREKHKIFRPDLIHLLMQARKGHDLQSESEHKATEDDSAGFATVTESSESKRNVNRKWDDVELVAQCFLFFLAGFDTTSTCLAFASYEMAINLETQEKLRREILDTEFELNGGDVTYDIIQKMKYMDMFISEVLRLWPPGPVTDRLCSKDLSYTFNGKTYEFKKGKQVWIPIASYHRDPKYYPDPEKFDPERFSDENKHKINAATYLPFGSGPRNCIGSRFALMEVKVILYHILKHYEICVCEDTVVPIKTGRFPEGIMSREGLKLELKWRDSSDN